MVQSFRSKALKRYWTKGDDAGIRPDWRRKVRLVLSRLDVVNVGKRVALMRDMTDTMYNHEMRPHVSHFAGTDLVIEHVEKVWCPSFTSSDLTGRPPFRFAEDTRRN